MSSIGCLCWRFVKESSVVAGKDGSWLPSFPISYSLGCPILYSCFFSMETGALVLICFPEKHVKTGCSRVILFTAQHPQGRTEHQHFLKTSAPFLILANRSRTHWGAEWVGQACETDRRREGRADCSHKFNLPRKWGLQYQLLAEAALPELLGQSWNHLKNLHG